MRLLWLVILSCVLYFNVLSQDISVGASQIDKYIDQVKNKTIAVVANHTSLVGHTHLVDTLVSMGVNVGLIFGPEHGFRGTSDAGEEVSNGVDPATGIRVISLYGNHVRPRKEDLSAIQAVVFDIQDVGVRFYTYISTMHYVMEACAVAGIPFIVLDRPNPNGYYVDGPVLDMKYKSFVGMHPVALVHGMTVGEYAQMINAEGWLEGAVKCKLSVVTCSGYTHKTRYILPVKPSPNLPNARSVQLYPSLGLTEGTVMSCGRGTDFPFQTIGHPRYNSKTFAFKPRSIPGASKVPPFMGQECYGIDLRNDNPQFTSIAGQLSITLLINAYKNTMLAENESFFNSFFTKLAGTPVLKDQIVGNIPETEIRKSWQPDIQKFKLVRKKYLLYPDFE